MFKKVIIGFLVLIIIAAGLGCIQFYSIISTGEQQQPQQNDVIIVLGAGVWANGPSPSMQGRTRHAAALYHQGYAQHLIVSGGLGDYPPTEAKAMQELLIQLDVPAESIILEEQSVNTEENIAYSKELMDQQGLNTALIVTDVFHLKRALLIAKKQGLTASGSAVKDSVLYTNKSLLLKYSWREVIALFVYKLRGSI